MNKPRQYFSIVEVCERVGLEENNIFTFIEKEWITPIPTANSKNASDTHLDHEDIARIELIRDLTNDLGINEEAVPVILHLIDQLHYLRNQLLLNSNKK